MSCIAVVPLLLAALAGCGDDLGPRRLAAADAARAADAAGDDDADAAPDATDASTLPAGCDYVESNDANNDPFAEGGAVEPTGLSFNGTGSRTICAQIDPANAIEGTGWTCRSTTTS